ncbi:MAG: SRPBCC family protein [Taibaiella sp.]|nr:SRPBCC family protein [Taibaiella sp.]
MKKFFRFLGILVLILVLAVVVLGLVEPKDGNITRTTVINAPQSVVFDQIVYFKNWPHWSPWYQMEPTATITYQGTDGQPGSSYTWTGDKTGAGTMTNKDVMNNNTLKFDTHFTKPMENTCPGSMKAEDAGNGQTKVTWSFDYHSPFPWNAMHAFMNMDKMVGKDFEKGLANMKAYVETHNTMPVVAVQETQFPGHLYVGVRKTVPMAELQKFFQESGSMLSKSLGNRIMGPSAGIFYNWDTVAHQADVAVVFPVADSSKRVPGAMYINVPAGKADMAVQNGGYSNAMGTHHALMAYVMNKKQEKTGIIEEYVTGPSQEKDSTKWVTNVYYLVK